jgi:hypothetical protein
MTRFFRKTAAELGIKLLQLRRSGGLVMLSEETSASRTTSLAEL